MNDMTLGAAEKAMYLIKRSMQSLLFQAGEVMHHEFAHSGCHVLTVEVDTEVGLPEIPVASIKTYQVVVTKSGGTCTAATIALEKTS